jgi:putative tryptophan/tyrosine transport system substrate-binding protein
MDRRTFITRAPLGLLAAPRAAHAQADERVRRIGTLSNGKTRTDAEFRQDHWARALRDLGWIEGQNVEFERRYADGRVDRLPDLARELVAAKVDVIATFFGTDHVAAKQASADIPIVMLYNGFDPVEDGLIASYARPGGNVTGVSRMLGETDPKRLELIREALPKARRLAVLAPTPAAPDRQAKFENRIRDAVRNAPVELVFFWYGNQDELESAFPAMEGKGIQGFVLTPQPYTFQSRERIARLAVKHRLPGVFTLREYAEAGGLMSYGPVWPQLLRQHARYVDRILRGASAAELPIEQPTQFEFVINLNTAAALGLKIPQSLLLRADDKIQ